MNKEANQYLKKLLELANDLDKTLEDSISGRNIASPSKVREKYKYLIGYIQSVEKFIK